MLFRSANLTEAVSLHHRPDLAKVQPILTAVVHVANTIARSLDIGSGGDNLVPPITRIAAQRLKLEPSQLRSIMLDVEKEYPEVQALLTV